MQRPPVPLTQLGGQHTAAQAVDGTWTVYDVPIFAAFTDVRRPDKPRVYDRGWLESVISRHASRLKEGYIAPAHVNHHGSTPTRRVGGFIPRRIESRTYEGKPLDFLLADLVGLSPADYAALKRLEFPHPSVEVEPSDTEIFSLALLSDEAPFFRTMISVGQEIPAERLEPTAAPAVAFRALPAGHRAVLFSFGGGSMTDAEPEKPADAEKSEASGTIDIAALNSAIKQFTDLAEVIKPLLPFLSQLKPQAEQYAEKAEEKKEGPVEMGAYGRKDKDNFAAGVNQALQDEVKALRAEVSQFKASQVAGDDVSRAKAALDKLGIRADAEKLAQYRAKGQAFLDGYVEALKTNYTAMPGRWTGEMQAPKKDSAEVAKFAAKGPDVLAKARKLEADYRSAPDSIRRSVSLDMFLAANVEDSLGEVIHGSIG